MQVCKGSKRSHWGSWATRRTSRSDLSCHTLILWIPDKAAVWMKIRQTFEWFWKGWTVNLGCLSWRLSLVSFSPWSWQEPQEKWTFAAYFSALQADLAFGCFAGVTDLCLPLGFFHKAWVHASVFASRKLRLACVFFSVAATFQQKAEISLELVVFLCVFFSVRWKWNVFDFVLVFLQISPGHKNRAELSWIIETWSLTWSVLRWRGCDCSRLLLSKFMSYTPTIKYTIVVVFWQNETIHCMSLCSCLDLVQH